MPGVLDKVKETLQRMTFSDSGDSQSQYHLATMNVPAQLGRRDAAYDRAVVLLREHLFSYNERGRSDIYAAVLDLLDLTIEVTKSLAPGDSDRRKGNLEPILQYLQLLKDTVNAAAALAKHELILYKDEKDLSSFMGSEISSQFRFTDQIFSDSEVNIYQCISELLDIAEPAMKRARDYRKRSFSKNNLDRYRKALSEFQKLYAKVGVTDEKSS